MLMRKVKPSPGVQLGHTEAMMKMPAKFSVKRKETKVIAMSKDVNTFVRQYIFRTATQASGDCYGGQ